MKYFFHCKLFGMKQFGFTEGRSTVTQLLTNLEVLTENVEMGGLIQVV